MVLKIVSESKLLLTIGNEIGLAYYYKLEAIKKDLIKTFDKEIINTLMGYVDLMIEVKDVLSSYKKINKWLEDKTFEINYPETLECIEIPVCYDQYFALDQKNVIEKTGLSWQAVIEKHTEVIYFCYFLGFTLGFPYLGGLDEQLKIPRKEVPRLKVAKGSVGIANDQTGIYPLTKPGGWQIIGKTPIQLYDLESAETLFKPGVAVKFRAISLEEYQDLETNPIIKKQVILWPY